MRLKSKRWQRERMVIGSLWGSVVAKMNLICEGGSSSEPHKLPITILSRCQRFDFKRIPSAVISRHLRYIVNRENIEITDSGLAMIARKGDGSMRDALSVLDQVLAFCGDKVADEEVVSLLGVVDRRLILETSRSVFARDCRGVLDIVKRVDSFGYNIRQFCQELIDHFRSMTIISAVGPAADLPDLSEAEVTEIRDEAAKVGLNDMQRHLSILLKAENEISDATFPRLVLEMALLKMATLVPAVPVNELLERLKVLERPGPGEIVASSNPSWDNTTRGKERTPTTRTEFSNSIKKEETPAPPEGRGKIESEAHSASKGEKDPWYGFVNFVKGKKPLLASHLEHGRPIMVSPGHLEIGFPDGSFHLKSVRDTSTIMELRGLATTFFRTEPEVKIVPLTESPADAPATLLEKKSLDEAERSKIVEDTAKGHPMVAAALEIFGGEIEEIKAE